MRDHSNQADGKPVHEARKESPEELISRKEALAKAGKYAAFTAASLITILNPVKSQPYSSEYPDMPPEWFY